MTWPWRHLFSRTKYINMIEHYRYVDQLIASCTTMSKLPPRYFIVYLLKHRCQKVVCNYDLENRKHEMGSSRWMEQ